MFTECKNLASAAAGPDGGTASEIIAATGGGVAVSGDLELGLRLCMGLRTAGRVLIEVVAAPCSGSDELYALAGDIPWERHFEKETTFAISARGGHRTMTDHRFAVLRVKDAVADRFRDRTGVRPSVDSDDPGIHIFLYLGRESATIYVDLSRTGLHHRDYRVESTTAPLRENLAAGALLAAGWGDVVDTTDPIELPSDNQRKAPLLVDPMCGSGTIAIEGALMACRVAPGLIRKTPIAEKWLGFDRNLWNRVVEEATDTAAKGREAWRSGGGRIWASDIDPASVDATRRNAEAAGVGGEIHIDTADFFRLPAKAVLAGRVVGADDRGGTTFLVSNPPYGKRIAGAGGLDRSRKTDARSTGAEEQESQSGHDFYERIGSVLAERYRGFRASLFAPDRDHAKALGLRADSVTTLLNGPTEVSLAHLSLAEDNRFRSRQDRAGARGPTEGVAALANRLKKNLRDLSEAGIDEAVGPFRLYDADIPQHSAAIDFYPIVGPVGGAIGGPDGGGGGSTESYFVVQEYQAPKHINPADASKRFHEIVDATRQVFGVPESRVIQKRRMRQRGRKQYQRQSPNSSIIGNTREAGHLFEVNLTDYIDTGIFPDHRLVRKLLAETAAGGRFLNLFAYTSTATVYALAAGAETAVSVDTSNVYLEWGVRNLSLNGLSAARHRSIRADAREFLEQDRGSYDVIFVDPPSFSNSKSRESDFDVQRDHARLLHLASFRLSGDGMIVFSTNLRGFRLDPTLETTFEIRDISEDTLARDFARSKSRSRHHVWVLVPME